MSDDAALTVTTQVRLRVELVVEIADPAVLTQAAVEHLREDEMAAESDQLWSARTAPATDADAAAVAADPAEALSSLIDPFDLVKGLSGVQLAQASWASEQIEPGSYAESEWLDEV